jgi:inner membrane protein
MDPLTHFATGLFLGRAGLNRFTPYATPILLLAANAPDVDVVTAAGGPLTYLNYHRHLTHAIPMLPLMAILPVLVVRPFARKPIAWKGAYLISLVAVALHLALDSTNVYGIRLLLPFSGRWFHLDLTSVIDLWIWAVSLVAIAGPLITRLVSSEIGAATRRQHGRGSAILALLFILLYNCGHALLHMRAVAVLDARIYQGSPPLRVLAAPDPVNPWRFRGVVETREFYSLNDVNLRVEDFDPGAGRVFYKPDTSPAVTAAAATSTFRDFLRFAQYPFWLVVPLSEPENAVAVQAMDMRFGSPLRPGFVATALVDAQMRVVRSWFTFGAAKPR